MSEPELNPTGRGKSLRQAFASLTRKSPVILTAPIAGECIPLSDVSDKVFSSGALGDGVGIIPATGEVVAPTDGTVQAAMPHAYGIVNGDLELLVHIGVDTVELGGKHFTQEVNPGDAVRRGTVLAHFDVAAIREKGYDPVVMVIVTKHPSRAEVSAIGIGQVNSGSAIIEISSK